MEPKLAAWLNFNAKLGDVFTMRQFRDVLGDADAPNAQEHFNRRFRALRKFGWIVLSSRDSGDLAPDQYRLAKVGAPIWLGKSKHGAKGISDKTRREIFDRDGYRCVICGIGSGEAYPGEPARVARLTLGHFVADSLRGSTDPFNLRTECARCNEPVKEHARRSESAVELWPKIRDLSRANKTRLFSWLGKGCRDRDTVDVLFDQIRVLPALQRDEIHARLQRALQGSP